MIYLLYLSCLGRLLRWLFRLEEQLLYNSKMVDYLHCCGITAVLAGYLYLFEVN